MRKQKKYVFMPLLLPFLLWGCAHALTTQKSSAPNTTGITFVEFVPSPDGRQIAFEYKDNSFERNYVALGLYDWQTGRLIRIPNPTAKQLSEPSFSYDGKRLLVGEGVVGSMLPTEIGVVDLDTMQTRSISSSINGVKQYPVFQPGTDNILYVDYQNWNTHRLALINPTKQTEQIILDGDAGFLRPILRPSFVSQNKIIFQAAAPRNLKLRNEIIHLELGPTDIAYQLEFGSLPEVLSVDAEQHTYRHQTEGAFNSVTASRDGQILAYISNNLANKEAGTFNWELFKIENGQTTQLTNIQGFKSGAHISYNGSVITFAADPAQTRQYDLFIFKMAGGEIVATHLLDRIAHDPAFVLQ